MERATLSRRGFLGGVIAAAAILPVQGPHMLLAERPRAVAVAALAPDAFWYRVTFNGPLRQTIRQELDEGGAVLATFIEQWDTMLTDHGTYTYQFPMKAPV